MMTVVCEASTADIDCRGDGHKDEDKGPDWRRGGLVANGEPVYFTEQATYQFLDGKIQRIWGMMNFSEARLAQQPASTMPLFVPVI